MDWTGEQTPIVLIIMVSLVFIFCILLLFNFPLVSTGKIPPRIIPQQMPISNTGRMRNVAVDGRGFIDDVTCNASTHATWNYGTELCECLDGYRGPYCNQPLGTNGYIEGAYYRNESNFMFTGMSTLPNVNFGLCTQSCTNDANCKGLLYETQHSTCILLNGQVGVHDVSVQDDHTGNLFVKEMADSQWNIDPNNVVYAPGQAIYILTRGGLRNEYWRSDKADGVNIVRAPVGQSVTLPSAPLAIVVPPSFRTIISDNVSDLNDTTHLGKKYTFPYNTYTGPPALYTGNVYAVTLPS